MKATKKQIEQRKKNLQNYDSNVQRGRRLNQIAAEQKIAKRLIDDGWEIFSPTVVCDRVGIKDGKAYLIEFKKKGQELREGQKKIHDLLPDNYKIVYD